MKEIRTKPRQLLMRRRTAAEALDTSISRLKRLEQAGRLKAVRIGNGRDVYYHTADIERLARGED